jgi:hypothetical protein
MKLLMERVAYVNTIRMGVFRFYIIVVGAFVGLVYPRLPSATSGATDWCAPALWSIGLIVLAVGLSMFCFDLCALARLRATTRGIEELWSPARPPVPRNRLIRRFGEDFWIVQPMIVLNSALAWFACYSWSCATCATGSWVVGILLLVLQLALQQVVPTWLASRMGAWPDTVSDPSGKPPRKSCPVETKEVRQVETRHD